MVVWPKFVGLFLVIVTHSVALDNGYGRKPPMGWRSWNAFGMGVTQTKMEAMMEAMVDRSRTVDGKPTSLLDLGYNFCGLDDGWQKCGAGVNGSFHTANGDPIVDTKKFPSLSAMVDKAHSLGLHAGFYMNNCGCNEHEFKDPDMIAKVMQGSVRALRQSKFDGLKLDSCGEFNNLTWWNQLINVSGPPVLIENCHQGGLAPGAVQWQTYLKNRSSASEYTHLLGYLSAGSDAVPPLPNTTAAACLHQCSASASCLGISFEADVPMPTTTLKKCYLKSAVHFVPYDASNSRCTGRTMPSDCPYNFFRTSGDINARFASVLGNLASTVPYLGNDSLSRPGAWAYPDMLEVGRLHSLAEERTHFAAWSVVSSPLILGFDLTDKDAMERVWPIVSNREVIAVNQAWAGSAGHRVVQTMDFQVWSKPLDNRSMAVLVFSNSSSPVHVSVPLDAISSALAASGVARARDILQHRDQPVDQLIKKINDTSQLSVDGIAAHDCRMFTLTSSDLL